MSFNQNQIWATYSSKLANYSKCLGGRKIHFLFDENSQKILKNHTQIMQEKKSRNCMSVH